MVERCARTMRDNEGSSPSSLFPLTVLTGQDPFEQVCLVNPYVQVH